MAQTLVRTDFQFPHQDHVYHGKVRDVYFLGSEQVAMIATDRISAFDVVLPKGIPLQGTSPQPDRDLLPRSYTRHRPQLAHLCSRPYGIARPTLLSPSV